MFENYRRAEAAHHMMAQEPPGPTLQTTALVHEAWLRLNDEKGPQPWQSRAHFIAAAEAMRRILVDRARRKPRQKHGGGLERLDAGEVDIAIPTPHEDLIAVHDALEKLAQLDPRQAELVKLKYFAGLEVEDAAKVLGISKSTAARDWTHARAWLYREIQAQRSG